MSDELVWAAVWEQGLPLRTQHKQGCPPCLPAFLTAHGSVPICPVGH